MKVIEGNFCQCSTCIHESDPLLSDACDGCCPEHSNYLSITAEEGIKMGEWFAEGFRKGLEDGKNSN